MKNYYRYRAWVTVTRQESVPSMGLKGSWWSLSKRATEFSTRSRQSDAAQSDETVQTFLPNTPTVDNSPNKARTAPPQTMPVVTRS